MNGTPKSNFGLSSALCFLSTFILAVTAWANTTPDDSNTLDNRNERLETFFQSFGCPAPHHVNEYLVAADTNAIDYRLLPVISVLESTCGIHQRQNNHWGWDSARKGFASFRAGLEYIAHQLAEGHYYKNKTLDEKVRTYNPNPQYSQQVKKLMRKIDDRGIPIRAAASSSGVLVGSRTQALALSWALTGPAGAIEQNARSAP